jgi:hypothetical protein
MPSPGDVGVLVTDHGGVVGDIGSRSGGIGIRRGTGWAEQTPKVVKVERAQNPDAVDKHLKSRPEVVGDEGVDLVPVSK